MKGGCILKYFMNNIHNGRPRESLSREQLYSKHTAICEAGRYNSSFNFIGEETEA